MEQQKGNPEFWLIWFPEITGHATPQPSDTLAQVYGLKTTDNELFFKTFLIKWKILKTIFKYILFCCYKSFLHTYQKRFLAKLCFHV